MKKENGQSAAKLVDNENMKPIPGYEEFYLASRDGKIYSKRYNKFLKPAVTKDGYKQVSLVGNNKKQYTYKVHRLIAMTFLDNPDNLPEVNHKDFNRLNNFVSNLEWCSHYDNVKHSRECGNYDCIYKQTRKAYVFTNVFSGKSFTILGFKQLLKQLHITPANSGIIYKYANTGDYVKRGILKGLKVDIINLEVRRSTAINGVEPSGSKE